MTWLNPPIDGATLKGALLRVLAYAAVGGAEGIVSLNDCRVVTTTTPSSSIRVLEGGVLVLNRYLEGVGQTYPAYNDAADTVATTTTGGGARSDLVVLRINDPEYSGTGPAEGEEDAYPYAQVVVITGVPGTTKTAEELDLGYPAIALARIDRPGSTSTVTSGHIVDLRKLARPRSEEHLNHLPIDSAGTNPLNDTAYASWPILLKLDVDVPEWAAQAKITGFVEGLRLENDGEGALRVVLVETGVGTEATNINESAPDDAADRRSYFLGGEIPIPSAQRGTTCTFRVQGKVITHTSDGFLKTDSNASGSLRILLQEVPS